MIVLSYSVRIAEHYIYQCFILANSDNGKLFLAENAVKAKHSAQIASNRQHLTSKAEQQDHKGFHYQYQYLRLENIMIVKL